MAIKIKGNTAIYDDQVFRTATGATAERPVSPETGMIRFNTDSDAHEIYANSVWKKVVSSDTVIATPTISVTGSPSSVPENPTISTLAFSVANGTSTHTSTDWEVRRSSNNQVVFSSYNNTVNLTSIVVSSGLEVSTSYVFRARHIGTNFGESLFGSNTANTLASFGPTTLGQSFGGGFYIGTICAASTCYYLIMAPNATGCACCQWKTAQTTTSGTSSCVDGYSNTYGPMTNANHPAGNWTATRTIGGFSDWYLPARDELNQLYTNKGSSPAGEGFAAGSYWSSTELSAGSACVQYFGNGGIGDNNKTITYRVRAVRRLPI